MQGILEDDGLLVEGTADGAEAVAEASHHPPTLVAVGRGLSTDRALALSSRGHVVLIQRHGHCFGASPTSERGAHE